VFSCLPMLRLCLILTGYDRLGIGVYTYDLELIPV